MKLCLVGILENVFFSSNNIYNVKNIFTTNTKLTKIKVLFLTLIKKLI